MKSLANMGRKIRSVFSPGNDNEINYFDVKDLYDRAFSKRYEAEKLMQEYEALFFQASCLDQDYRAQITLNHNSKYGKVANA